MAYRIVITKNANVLIRNSINYLLRELRNIFAADHLSNEIESILNRIKENPYQFPIMSEKTGQYRIAIIPNMKYLVVFKIVGRKVYIMGLFHQSESYQDKLN